MINFKILDGFNKYTDYILKSFFCKSFYEEVFSTWQTRNLICYIFFLISVTTIFTVYKPLSIILKVDSDKIQNFIDDKDNNANSNNDINYIIAELIKQIPELQLESGKLISSTKQPTKILYPNSEKIFAVIDTESDNISTISPITILKEKVIYSNYDKSTGKFSPIYEYYIANMIISNEISLTLNENLLIEYISKIKTSVIILGIFGFIPFLYLLSIFTYISDCLLISSAGFIYLKIKNLKCNFIDIFRISAVSYTPSVIFVVIFDNFISPNSNYIYFISFILGIIYFYYFLSYNIKLREKSNLV